MKRFKTIMAAAAALFLVGAVDAAIALADTDDAGITSDAAVSGDGVRVSLTDIEKSADLGGDVITGTNSELAATGAASGVAASASGTVTRDDETGDSAESAAIVTSDANRGGASSGGSASAEEASAASSAPIFLSTGDDTCMGSSGVGVQAFEVGLTVGSTWDDSDCIMLKNARELSNQGHPKAAKARLCMNEDNALAFEMTGVPCPRALPSTQAALEKIQQWNPQYAAAAAPGAQLASNGSVAAIDTDTTVTDDDSGWFAPKISAVVAMVTSVLDHAGSDQGPGSADAATAMDGVE